MGKNGKSKNKHTYHGRSLNYIVSGVPKQQRSGMLWLRGLDRSFPKKVKTYWFSSRFFPQSSSVRLAQHGGPNSAGVPSLDSKGVKIHGRVKNWPLTWRTNIHNIAISWRSWFAMVQIPSDCKDLAFEYPWPFLLVGRSSCHHPQPPF